MKPFLRKLKSCICQPLVVSIIFVFIASVVTIEFDGAKSQPPPPTRTRKHNQNEQTRDPKLMYFPFVKVVIPPEPCGAETNGVRSGVCLPRGGCEKARGVKGSDCSYGFGECCEITTNCTADRSRVDVIDYVTLLKTPTPSTTQCTFKIRKLKDMCQVRLDFLEYTSTPADSTGDCLEDKFVISNSITVKDAFTTCGTLTKQHMYLAFGGSESIDITPVIRSTTGNYRIVVTQIPCLSRRVVPSHCLQYYNKTTDIIKTFDYGRQQQNKQRYTICVEATEQSESIAWMPCTAADGVIDRAFQISSAIAPIHSTTEHCTKDWIQINGENRRCGESFPPSVMSTWKPYTINVNFDENEIPPFPALMAAQGANNSADCLAIQTSSGGLLSCYWDDTVTRACQCQFALGFHPEAIFGVPDDANVGFCLKYQL